MGGGVTTPALLLLETNIMNEQQQNDGRHYGTMRLGFGGNRILRAYTKDLCILPPEYSQRLYLREAVCITSQLPGEMQHVLYFPLAGVTLSELKDWLFRWRRSNERIDVLIRSKNATSPLAWPLRRGGPFRHFGYGQHVANVQIIKPEELNAPLISMTFSYSC